MSTVLPRSAARELGTAVGEALRRKRRPLALLAGALLAILFLSRIVSGGRKPGDVVVRRGTLEPTVPLVGMLVPERSDSYGAAVPGVELKILWLAEEGTLVAPGDKLIQFDPAPFQKEMDTALARVHELSGETEGARLAVEALRLKTSVELQEKASSLELSQQELSSLVNTAAPLSAQESANETEQRERALAEAETKLAGLEPFVAEGYISQEEFRTAQSKRDQAAADLRLAKARHAALVHQTTPDLIRKKSQETETGRLEAGLSKEKARLDLAQAEAASRVSAARFDEASRQVGEAEKKILACTVIAKAPGLAVHSETFDKSGERRKIRVGDSVWGGTTVVTLPDLTAMLVEGHVPESEIHQLSPSQPVRVQLDAFPGLALTGSLRSIGSVSGSGKNDSRSFPVTVALIQADPRFRPGMVARCSVVCLPVKDVLFVPIEAVHSDDQGQFVFAVSRLSGSTSPVRIHTGITTAQFVEVRDGIAEGALVRPISQ